MLLLSIARDCIDLYDSPLLSDRLTMLPKIASFISTRCVLTSEGPASYYVTIVLPQEQSSIMGPIIIRVRVKMVSQMAIIVHCDPHCVDPCPWIVIKVRIELIPTGGPLRHLVVRRCGRILQVIGINIEV